MDNITPELLRQIIREELAKFKDELLAERVATTPRTATSVPDLAGHPLATMTIAEWVERHPDLPTQAHTALRYEFMGYMAPIEDGAIPRITTLVGYARAGRLKMLRQLGKKGEAAILEKLEADGLYSPPTKRVPAES